MAFVELAAEGLAGSQYGVGMHPNIVTASILAIFSAVNRIAARGITVTPAAEASDGVRISA